MDNPFQQLLSQSQAPTSASAAAPQGNPFEQLLVQTRVSQDPWQGFLQEATESAGAQGFPKAVIAGQAALESGHGTSNFARERNNYFGYEAYDSNPDAAKAYTTPQQSIDDYLSLVEGYPGVQQAIRSGNPDAVLRAIKAAGYATDPNYVQKVEGTPEYQYYAGGGQ